MSRANIGDLKITATLDAQGVKLGADKARSEVDKLGKDMKGLLTSFAGGLGVGMSLDSLAGSLANSIRSGIDRALSEYKQGRQAEIKLGLALGNAGGAAGVEIDQIRELADEMNRLTKFTDDQTMSAAAMLSQFTAIRGSTFTGTLRAAADIAAFSGQSIESVTETLGRALSMGSEGLRGMRGLGFVATPQQEAAIKAAEAAGDTQRAMQIMLDMTRGMSGAAQALTTSGDLAKNAVDDLAESIGRELNPAMRDMNLAVVAIATTAKSLIDWVANNPVLKAGLRTAVGVGLDMLPGVGPAAGLAYGLLPMSSPVDNSAQAANDFAAAMESESRKTGARITDEANAKMLALAKACGITATEVDKMGDWSKRMIESTMTAEERRNAELGRLQFAIGSGKLSTAEAERINAKINEDYAKATAATSPADTMMQQMREASLSPEQRQLLALQRAGAGAQQMNEAIAIQEQAKADRDQADAARQAAEMLRGLMTPMEQFDAKLLEIASNANLTPEQQSALFAQAATNATPQSAQLGLGAVATRGSQGAYQAIVRATAGLDSPADQRQKEGLALLKDHLPKILRQLEDGGVLIAGPN